MTIPILIILAGGRSARMGTPKGLLDCKGTPWILEQISRYKNIHNPRVYIGLGYDYKLYFKQIPWFEIAIEHSYIYKGVKVSVFINNHPKFGSFSTLQTVLKKVSITDSVLVLPIDVPLLDEENLQRIVSENNTIIIPTCNANNGHPVKLNPVFWKTLLPLENQLKKARLDVQIKNLNRSSKTFIEVDDISVYQNINTIKKWNEYIDLF